MRVLVTGATGCVGANIVEALLLAGYQVRALKRPSSRLDALEGLDVEFAIGDVTVPDSLLDAARGCNLVFHTAAISQYWRSDRDTLYKVNVVGTRNLLAAALAGGVNRVVVTSTIAVFGVPRHKGELLDETYSMNVPAHYFPYGHSKWLAEQEVDAAISRGLDVVVVNPTSVIGQRDVYFVGGELLRMTHKGQFLVAPPGGMGVVRATEVGTAHVLAAERGRTGERYILNGQNMRHFDLIRLIAEVTGGTPPLFPVPRALMLAAAAMGRRLQDIGLKRLLVDPAQLHMGSYEIFGDGQKAKAELGFVGGPARSAIEEAWAWYRDRHLL